MPSWNRRNMANQSEHPKRGHYIQETLATNSLTVEGLCKISRGGVEDVPVLFLELLLNS